MRYFFVNPSDIRGQTALVKGSDAHHIKNVLRLNVGDRIGLFDGTGLNYETRIVTRSPKSIEVSIVRSFPSTAESNIQITVAQAMLKDRKMDLLVKQLTEIGITKWIPFIAERSVPIPDKKRLTTRTERWQKIAQEAVKQCKRACPPEIDATLSFEETLNHGKDSDLKIIFWEEESKPLYKDHLASQGKFGKKIFILIGPEGGFTLKEVKKAKESDFVTAALGPRILRSETATIAACTLLQYLFGDMGK
jgi:16S rRNA (uracil1498-N3)-methyltransferase